MIHARTKTICKKVDLAPYRLQKDDIHERNVPLSKTVTLLRPCSGSKYTLIREKTHVYREIQSVQSPLASLVRAPHEVWHNIIHESIV